MVYFQIPPSIDHLGPMGESVISTAITYSVLEGYYPPDTKSVQHERINLDYLEEPIEGFKIAMCPDLYENQEIDNAVQESLYKCNKYFERPWRRSNRN